MPKSLSTPATLSLAAAFLATAPAILAEPPAPTARPDVLFVIIDDLNDWIAPLGRHPLVRTPAFDRLAERGVTFTNAHCQGPLCAPSRASLLTGLRPTTTGLYALEPGFRTLPAWDKHPTLPQTFRNHGWQTATMGKVWHAYHAWAPEWRATEFDIIGTFDRPDPRPDQKLVTPPTPDGNLAALDWGVFPHRDEDKRDYQAASWAVARLENRETPNPALPRFTALGFTLPHLPCYITQPWMDLYPDDDAVLLPLLKDDRTDTPQFSWALNWRVPEPRLSWMLKNDELRKFTRAYLASISFMDAQLGRVLDALDRSGRADRTIIVVTSDNGYHMGEQEITGKNTLWERSTKVPLIIAGPGIPAGTRVTAPVELLDIYPTLLQLAGLPGVDGLEGVSLVPQLRDPAAPRSRPAITSHGQGNHAIRTERWRYIRYADGSEELYDHASDPDEWHNVAPQPESAEIMADLRKWIPSTPAPPVPGSRQRLIEHDPATGVTKWQLQPINPFSDPIPDR